MVFHGGSMVEATEAAHGEIAEQHRSNRFKRIVGATGTQDRWSIPRFGVFATMLDRVARYGRSVHKVYTEAKDQEVRDS